MQTVSVNSILCFLLEVIMLFAFGYVGFQLGGSFPGQIGLAVFFVVLAGFAWGYWAAPKSKNQLPIPWINFFRLGMFLLSAWALYYSGFRVGALLVAIASILNQSIDYYNNRRKPAI